MFTGYDYIAGEKTSRGWAAVGIVAGVFPCGKGILKGTVKGGEKLLSHADDVGKVSKVVQKAKKIETGADAIEQLESIEKAQRALRQGKLTDVIIDSTGKSQQRVKNKLKNIRSLEDAIDEGL